MGRLPRIHYSGAVYHAMARGVDGRDIYGDDADRADFLNVLKRVASASAAEVLAYCLMGNHFHLAIKVGRISLSSVMQRILTPYAMKFNRRYDRAGHLFEARHKAKLCRDEKYLACLIPYIHMNPVRAGLVGDPGDWPWSSYRPEFGVAALPQDFNPWGENSGESSTSRSLDIEKPDLAAIGLEISSRTGVGVDRLRSASRDRVVVAAKRLLVQEAFVRGHALASVAEWIGTTRSSVSRYAAAR